ncbi:MAG: phosphoadenylyl-sulfate reductase [Cucumibacter sp.]
MALADLSRAAPAGFVDRRKKDKLRALGVIALNGMLGEKDAPAVLKQAAEILPDDFAVVSSFGADSVVLLHMVAELDRHLPVIFLDTQKHFEETLSYVETIRRELGLTRITALTPDPADLARFDPTEALWETDPDSCCHIRKTVPLNAALDGFGGWVTGRRRYQTSERGILPHFELTSDDRIKVNPLAYWTYEDVETYKAGRNLPEHPLVARGYRSIGCATCTSAVGEGENPRAGRWRGLNKAECGIHFDFNAEIASPVKHEQWSLFKSGRFIADPWRTWVEGDDPASVKFTHVPLKAWAGNREAFARNPHPVGLSIEPIAGDRVEAVGGELDKFNSIAVAFPKFTDGRGYSAARLIRERFGYRGELRAVGDILADQAGFLRRCGFDALVVTDKGARRVLEEDAVKEVSVYLQPVGSSGEVPAGTRPFLRKADR